MHSIFSNLMWNIIFLIQWLHGGEVGSFHFLVLFPISLHQRVWWCVRWHKLLLGWHKQFPKLNCQKVEIFKHVQNMCKRVAGSCPNQSQISSVSFDFRESYFRPVWKVLNFELNNSLFKTNGNSWMESLSPIYF